MRRLVGLADAAARTGRAVRALTPFGAATVAVAVLSLVAVAMLGWREFIGPAVAAGAMLVMASAALRADGRRRVRVEAPARRVTVGGVLEARIVVEHGGRGRTPASLVEAEVRRSGGADDAWTLEEPVPALARGGRRTIAVAVPTDRRAVVRVGPVRTVRTDPLRLVRQRGVRSAGIDVHVHPRVVRAPVTGVGVLRDLEGAAASRLSTSDLGFHALREYREGDDRRAIHWRSSARTGALMVRQFEETRRSDLVVVLGTGGLDAETEEDFELAVQAAASLAVTALRDGRGVRVVAGGATIAATEPGRLLDAFAGLVRGGADLPETVAGLADRRGLALVVLVTGRTGDAARAAGALPTGIRALAVVCDPGAAPSLVSGRTLPVLTVGALDDLRRLAPAVA